MWKNDSIDGWERKEKSWINVGLNPDVTWWIHSFIKWRVMFFFFKLLLKTFNNFLKDKCNVSTIFCYFKTEKLLNSYHSWKNIAIHQDFEVTTSYFSTFELLTIFEKSKYRDISKLSRNGFRSTIHEKLDDFLFLYSHFRISCFIFFWNIKHRSIIGILSALLAEKLQFYSSFKWLSRVFESNPGEMS